MTHEARQGPRAKRTNTGLVRSYRTKCREWVPLGFLTEIGKQHDTPGGYGSFSLAMLRETCARLRERATPKLHLITRHQWPDGTPFHATTDARAKFTWLGAREVRRLDALPRRVALDDLCDVHYSQMSM